MTAIGPLLQSTLNRLADPPHGEMGIMAAHVGGDHESGALPIYARLPRAVPEHGEGWADYRQRVLEHLGPLAEKIAATMGVTAIPLLAGNAIQLNATVEQVQHLRSFGHIEVLDLDPPVQATLMDDATQDIDLSGYQSNHPNSGGAGIRVAVLDSGIDAKHPFL